MKSRRILSFVLFLAATGMLMGPNAGAEFYRYVDKNGHTVFVDDVSKIPEEHRGAIQSYGEKDDHLTPEQRAIRREREESLARERQVAEDKEAAEARRLREEEKTRTRIVVEGNRVLVPATLGYNGAEIEAMLVLDTGASVITLYREVADGLGIRELKKAKLRVAGGKIIDAETVQLQYVKIGPHRKEGLKAVVIDHQGKQAAHAGLLGMNFLGGVAYSIDLKESVIHWAP